MKPLRKCLAMKTLRKKRLTFEALSLLAGLGFAASACKTSSDARHPTMLTQTASDDESGAAQCKETTAELEPFRPFMRSASRSLAARGQPLHSARDVIAYEGDKVTVSARFTYGISGAELVDEEVDVYFLRACGVDWEKLATFKTRGTTAAESAAVGGALNQSGSDEAGRLSFELNGLLKETLSVGHYRLLLVVAGDHSSSEVNVEIINKKLALLVTDIDGVLSSSDLSGASTATSASPSAYAGAAELLQGFYSKGFAILYLTARPEWMAAASRAWLVDKGFPQGTLITTRARAPLTQEAAAAFKKQELLELKAQNGLIPCLAFGRGASDVANFRSIGIRSASSYYLQLKGDPAGGHVFADYKSLNLQPESPSALCN